MGCLGLGVAALLALAVPASIAPASLLGAYVVIGLLAAIAVAGVTAKARRRTSNGALPRRSVALAQVAVLTAVYAVVVTVIHATT